MFQIHLSLGLDAARIITNICYNLLLEITRYASISDVYNLINFDLISLTPDKVCLQTFCLPLSNSVL